MEDTNGDAFDLLANLLPPSDTEVQVVRLVFDDGSSLDVFRAEKVRDRPEVWRLAGFEGEADTPTEQRALLLRTLDGRGILTRPPSANGPTIPSKELRHARTSTRRLSDLATVMADAVRRLVGPPS